MHAYENALRYAYVLSPCCDECYVVVDARIIAHISTPKIAQNIANTCVVCLHVLVRKHKCDDVHLLLQRANVANGATGSESEPPPQSTPQTHTYTLCRSIEANTRGRHMCSEYVSCISTNTTKFCANATQIGGVFARLIARWIWGKAKMYRRELHETNSCMQALVCSFAWLQINMKKNPSLEWPRLSHLPINEQFINRH